MTDQVIVRRSSGGHLVFETPEGIFRATQDDIKNALFYGRKVLLARLDGIIDSEAMMHTIRIGFRGARRIVVTVGDRTFSTSDVSFIAVAKGKWAATSLAADANQLVDHVA